MIEKVKYMDFKLRFALERHSDFASFYQVFIENSYPHLLKLIADGDVVIDAGANIGIFTALASFMVGDSGMVLVVEPDPENVVVLRKNILINNLKNTILVEKALFQKSDETMDLISNGTMSKIISGHNSDSTMEFNRYSVKSITLDDLMTDLDITPTVLKMDIEGAEKFALKEASRTLKTLRYLEAEIHDYESEQELMKHGEFHFESSSAENRGNVRKFALKHPVKTFRLEYHNHFETAKRVLSNRKPTKVSYPKIIFGSR